MSTREILAEARNALQPVQILVDESGDADAAEGLRRALALISEVYDRDVATEPRRVGAEKRSRKSLTPPEQGL